MAIFTKDGKVYVVEGPNPLVKKQTPWDPSKLVFHNMSWDEITQNASRTRTPTPNKAAQTKAVTAAQHAQSETAEEPEPSEPKEEADDAQPNEESAEAPPKEEEPEEKKRAFELPYIKYKVLCHCLPAKVEHRTDSLYGESWGRIKYGKKFVFPCVVISAGDLLFEFWTSDPREQIAEKSVIYPFSYEVHNQATDSHDRVPYDDYRWWRVSSKEPKEGGWFFTANPSDFQPDFSD